MSDKKNLSLKIDELEKGKIFCIGDLILDNFIYGDVSRISPEAPVPILRVHYKTHMLGGAGNVVRNIISLGAQVCFIAAIGRDPVGSKLTTLIGEEDNIEPYLQVETARISSEKTRYIAGNQQLLRCDFESTEHISKSTEKNAISLAKSLIKQNDVVVLSDYAKGMLTPALIKAVIGEARKQKKPVIVDPKKKDYSVYKGVTIITPNLKELATATGMPVTKYKNLKAAAEKLLKICEAESVLVTRGKDGMSLFKKDGAVFDFPSVSQEIYDVSGAGDTVVACLGAALAAGLSLEDAVQISNVAAGIVVGRIGTAQVFRTDIKTALVTQDMIAGTHKILPAETANTQIERWRKSGLKIGFTNGCFDLIHPGHISLMDQAKNACDKLIVGLNSDSSVRRLKGKSRPIQNEMSRALVLASIEAVDMVIIFREDTPEELLKIVRPDVLVKGEDYKKSEVVGGKFVESYGGKVVLAKLSHGQSTSNIVKKISA